MSKQEIDLRFHYPYKGQEGKCPKCGHRTFKEGQVAACPPCERCPSCGYHGFEQHMEFVDFELLKSMSR